MRFASLHLVHPYLWKFHLNPQHCRLIRYNLCLFGGVPRLAKSFEGFNGRLVRLRGCLQLHADPGILRAQPDFPFPHSTLRHSVQAMAILFAFLRLTQLSLCHRSALPAGKSEIYVLEGVSIMFVWFPTRYSKTLSLPPFLFQGDEEETLNILRRIYKINNPRSETDYNVTKVVEDLEFIDNDTREISNVSKNPFVMLWKQTCLLFSKKNGGKTVLICLMQVSALGERLGKHAEVMTQGNLLEPL